MYLPVFKTSRTIILPFPFNPVLSQWTRKNQNHTRPRAVWFHICGIWEKAKLWRQTPAQELPGTWVGKEGVAREGALGNFPGGWKRSVSGLCWGLHDHTFVKTYQTLQKDDFLYHNKPEFKKKKNRDFQTKKKKKIKVNTVQWKNNPMFLSSGTEVEEPSYLFGID